MSAASDFLENNVLGHLFDSNWTPTSTYCVAICTVAPTDANRMEDLTECTYTGYSRIIAARGTTLWTVTNDTADNATAFVFPQCTGGSDDAAWWAIGDGVLGSARGASGDIYFHGALTATLSISNGITPEIGSGDLDITAA